MNFTLCMTNINTKLLIVWHIFMLLSAITLMAGNGASTSVEKWQSDKNCKVYSRVCLSDND